jgi:uncharacterized protein (TIGR00255 family)
MTGYGRATGVALGQSITVEVRCYNHRFKDIRLKLPKGWLSLEVPTENRIRDWMGRGRVECFVRSSTGGGLLGKPVLNPAIAQEYVRLYRELGVSGGQKNPAFEPTLELLAHSEGVIEFVEAVADTEQAWQEWMPILDEALRTAEQMRVEEGSKLAEEIGLRLRATERLLTELRGEVPAEIRLLQTRTEERIRTLAAQVEFTEDRLIQELAVLGERMDVTEELARMDSHLAQFRDFCNQSEPVGRELDFLLQEMNREINTIASKVRSAHIVRATVDLKAEVERIREQIQNIE